VAIVGESLKGECSVYTGGRGVQRAVVDEMDTLIERFRLEAVAKSGFSLLALDRVIWMLRAGEAVAARRLEYSGQVGE
jgi:hypothetical protein